MDKDKVVGIDFGEKRIGIALSDDKQNIALPFKTIETETKPRLTAEKLKKTLASYKLKKLVIGLPLHLDGKESPMSIKVRDFAKILEEVFHLPVDFMDERLTSSYIEKEMKGMDASRKTRAKNVDQLSATLLLQTYLDRQNNLRL